jgi:hypothetical protein
MQTAFLDLLARHKVSEGIDLAAYMMNTQNGWGAGKRNKQVLKSLRQYGQHAQRTFFPLRNYLKNDLTFSRQLQDFKIDISNSTDRPDLVSIAPYLGDYQIGDHYEMLITMEELRKKISTDTLPAYWEAYEILQKLVADKPDWNSQSKALLLEIMSIPRANDIVKAHLAINDIKHRFKNGDLTRDKAIEQLIHYQNKYDIDVVGPKLVYWFSSMTANRLKSGKDLK